MANGGQTVSSYWQPSNTSRGKLLDAKERPALRSNAWRDHQ
jgi:hypothetical protein